MFILFWVIVLCVYSVFWLLSLALLLWGRAAQSRLMSWMGGMPLALLSLVGLSAVAWEINDYYHPPGPEVAYEAFFGFAPSTDVKHMQASDDGSGDDEVAFLAFTASPTTIHKITAKGWKWIPPRNLPSSNFSSYRSSDAPAWWMPVKTKSSHVYEAHKRLGQFEVVEDELLVYDDATGQAYYSYDGLE